MSKTNDEINRIIALADLSSGVTTPTLKIGEKVWRFVRKVNPSEEPHFFTDGYGADAGAKSVGFYDPSSYSVVTYEVIAETQVLKTKINTGYNQFISDKLQNNIKQISIEPAH